MNGYKYKECWSKKGENFSVEIVNWNRAEIGEEDKYRELGMDTDMWNYYCYISPKHPLFDRLEEDMCNVPINNLHCGCTDVKWFRDENGFVTCKRYGCDYGHIWDDHFNLHDSKYKKSVVHGEAEELFQELSNYNIQKEDNNA